MGAIGLNPIRLDRIGLDPIRINAIKLGVPGASGSDRPYIDPEVLASLKAVCICYGKSNDDPDRAIVKNLVDPDNPFVISNAAYTEGSGYADKDSPYYGAFVTDGIDDLITSTKTVQEMGITDEVTVVSMIHQIDLNSTYTIATTNYIENSNSREHVRSDVYNYGKTGIYGYSASLINNTKSDIKNILGDEADYYVKSTNSLQTIFDAKFSVVGRISELTEASQVAWYWTIIANKVLTTDQINQVIAYFNLDRTLNPDILCNTIKQGITNENHAEFGDKLIDYSGNGRDIQLNNLAWKPGSGMGLYAIPYFTTWDIDSYYNGSYIDDYTGITVTDSKITVKEREPNSFFRITKSMPKLRVNVKFYDSNDIGKNKAKYTYIDSNGDIKTVWLVDGINVLPESYQVQYTLHGFFIYGIGIDIEVNDDKLNALCLDGVNDFGKVTGMPIYKDYTFIIEREFLNETFPNQVCLASKSKVPEEGENGGAFIVDNISVNSIINPYSFYKTTSLPGLNTLDRQIVFQSKYKYLDKDIAAGTAIDSDTLWLGTFRDNDSRFANAAIYSLMSFPYSMSEFLIERQLKKHKLGTLYPDMVEWRPIYTSNVNDYTVTKTTYFGEAGQFDLALGRHYSIGTRIRIYVKPNGAADEVTSIKVNGVELTYDYVDSNYGYAFNGTLSDKSPQKINITIYQPPEYLTMLSNSTLISNETLIKNE